MRESRFIEQNKEKWQAFEDALKGKTRDPEKLGELFIGITDDLSYARTFYPNRSVRVYLNNLSQRVFHALYRKRSGQRFRRFWSHELPAVLHGVRRELLLSFVIFGLAMVIGFFSSSNDEGFVRLILGDRYVAMTEQNIRSGDPMAVYKSGQELDFFFAITVNNIRVAFIAFSLGVFFGVGTVLVLLSNGIMLGTFLQFFHARNLLGEASLAVWLHGTLEISAIVIAGAAGLVMGRGLTMPGTFPRTTSFLFSAQRGVRVLIATVPLLIIAGFIEGFLTRHTDVPDALRLMIIFASVLLIVWYFVLLPYLRARSGEKEPPAVPLSGASYAIDFRSVKPTGEIFKDTFILMRRHIGRLLLVICMAAAALTAVLSFTALDTVAYLGWLDWLGFSQAFRLFASQEVLFVVGNSVAMSVVAAFALRWLRLDASMSKSVPKTVMAASMFGIGTNLLLAIGWPWGWLLAFALLPVICTLMASVALSSDKSFSEAMRFSPLLRGQLARTYGLFIIVLLMALICFFFIGSPLIWFLSSISKWFVDTEAIAFHKAFMILVTWLTLCAVLLCSAMFVYCFSLQYFTLHEIRYASQLRQRIARFGHQVASA